MKTTTYYREKFDKAVNKAEEEIISNPDGYKRKLKMYASLGYGFVFILIFLLVSMVVGAVWAVFASMIFLLLLLKKKLIFSVLGVTWVLVRSLFIKTEEPEGLELDREEYPRIWQEVDRRHKSLKTPSIDRLIMVPGMEVSIAQTPRFGIFGPCKNTLVLGLELLLTLSSEQAKAVLAHEFSHLSGKHNKFATQIYPVKLTWFRLKHGLNGLKESLTGLLQKLAHPYDSNFTDYSLVLAHEYEYKADAVSKALTSNDIAASALVAMHIHRDITAEYFWKPIYDKAYTEANPDNNVYNQLSKFILDPLINEDIVKRSVGKALKAKADSADIHPVLIDRLKALKSSGKLTLITDNAAQVWLAEKYDALIKRFNDEWVYLNKDKWDKSYNLAQESRVEIERLKNKPYEALSKQEAWSLATLTEIYCHDEDALSLYKKYLQKYPKNLDGIQAIGRILLGRNNKKGVAYMEALMNSDDHKQDAAEHLWQYYLRSDEKIMANRWLKQAEDAYDESIVASIERKELGSADLYHAPELSASENDLIGEIMGGCHTNKQVKEIWLAQKNVKSYKYSPVYILAFVMKGYLFDDEGFFEEIAPLVSSSKTVLLVTKATDREIYKRVLSIGMQVY